MSNKDIIEETYMMALSDIVEGYSTLDELKEQLLIFEEEEEYLICAGIHKAITNIEESLKTYKDN
jgi:hypothetical protein